MSLWRMEWARSLRQRENYVFLVIWILTLVLLGGLGQALPVAADYTNVSATLITVLGLLLPLFILLTTALHWGQEQESKRLNLLSTFTYPKWKLIFVRFSSFLVTQGLILLLAFLIASLVVGQSGKTWMILFSYAIGLTIYATALGTLLGLIARKRIRAMLLAFLTWTILVLLWPTLLVTIVSWLPYGMQVNGMIVALFLNGFDLMRVWASTIVSSSDVFGDVYLHLLNWMHRPIGYAVVWGVLLTMSGFLLSLASIIVWRKSS
ncbi:ABC transporter permease subunit [Exiguobacterium sp. s163]|uniref:ABC transporter permease subunit n=1 Tax=Exiguobacterium sp. s163 TaxID=2751287 RepID=UPI001BEC0484|nr:ABC transporter permease subunit [Exiguobacterium sp. s163]